jgi:hypothetical protein
MIDDLKAQDALLPLWMILLGEVILTYSIKVKIPIGGTPHAVNLMDHTIGTACIAWGAWRLSRFDLGNDFARTIRVILIIEILALVASLIEYWPGKLRPMVTLALVAAQIAQFSAAIAICTSALWLSSEYALSRAMKAWRTTRILFVTLLVFMLPMFCLGILRIGHAAAPRQTAAAPATTTGTVNLGILVILALVLTVAAQCAFCISIVQMRRDIRRRSGSRRGFQVIVNARSQ